MIEAFMKKILNQLLKFLLVIILAALVGAIVGAVDALFTQGVEEIASLNIHHVYIFTPFLPLAGLLIVFIYQKSGDKTRGGSSLIFKAARSKEDHVPLLIAPMVIIGTFLTHLFGGSSGKEGAGIQVGAAIGSNFGRLFKIDDLGQILLIVGISAAFSSLLGTPVAAIFFAAEITTIALGKIKALLPSAIGSISAFIISHYLGFEKMSLGPIAIPEVSIFLLFKVAIIGFIFGLFGFLVVKAFSHSHAFFKRMIKNPYLRVFIFSIPLALLLIFWHDGRYSGLGTNLILASFNGSQVYWYDFLAKMGLTVITLAIGFKGGKLIPIFATGATLGAVIAPIFGFNPVFGAAIGVIALFASTTNSLIWPLFFGAEMFGYQYMPFFITVALISYLCNFDSSIYSQKKIDMVKMIEKNYIDPTLNEDIK